MGISEAVKTILDEYIQMEKILKHTEERNAVLEAAIDAAEISYRHGDSASGIKAALLIAGRKVER